jgi:hypothetical protein
MHVSSLATPYSSFLYLLVSKSFFMRFVKNFRKERCIITLRRGLQERSTKGSKAFKINCSI